MLDHKRDPSRPHSLHVSRVMRIVAKEALLDQALDRNEPEDSEPQQQYIQRAVSAKDESNGSDQQARVNGMPHIGVRAGAHQLALRRDKTNVLAQTDSCPEHDHET